jgi:hypothetical protein
MGPGTLVNCAQVPGCVSAALCVVTRVSAGGVLAEQAEKSGATEKASAAEPTALRVVRFLSM